MTEHAESCKCGSNRIKMAQKLESVDGETSGYAKLSCCDCGFTLNYPMRLPSSSKKTPERIQAELVVLWNRIVTNESIEKQLDVSTTTYLKEDLVVSLLSLTKTIKSAEDHGYDLSTEAKEKLWDALKQMRKVRQAIEAVEKSCEKHFQDRKMLNPVDGIVSYRDIQCAA